MDDEQNRLHEIIDQICELSRPGLVQQQSFRRHLCAWALLETNHSRKQTAELLAMSGPGVTYGVQSVRARMKANVAFKTGTERRLARLRELLAVDREAEEQTTQAAQAAVAAVEAEAPISQIIVPIPIRGSEFVAMTALAIAKPVASPPPESAPASPTPPMRPLPHTRPEAQGRIAAISHRRRAR
jgi:hypothetical protein